MLHLALRYIEVPLYLILFYFFQKVGAGGSPSPLCRPCLSIRNCHIIEIKPFFLVLMYKKIGKLSSSTMQS